MSHWVGCSWNARARTIFEATKTHATNLMKYVALYKTLLLIQKKANGGKERNFDTFFAGLVGGYLVFGNRNPVNEQVRALFPPCGKGKPILTCECCKGRTLYLLSRNRVIHTPRCCYPKTTRVGNDGETGSSRLAIFFHLRRARVGLRDVVVRTQG